MSETLFTLGDLLKSSPQHQIAISAPKGTKMGELVLYSVRNKYLVALSDEDNGKVLVQPHNCIINLEHVKLSNAMTSDKLKKEGDNFGILYINEVKESTSSEQGG